MRTAKEIRNYLKQQKWYKDFVYNIKKTYSKRKAKHLIRGYFKKNSIGCAFLWDRTPQGHEFWEAIENNFKMWYEKGGAL